MSLYSANDPEFHPKKKMVRRQEIEEEGSNDGDEELCHLNQDF
jgi:hypothetical protein